MTPQRCCGAGSTLTLAGSRLIKSCSKYWRKAVASVLLLCFCCAVLPLPFDVSINTTSGSHEESTEAFPCQGCGCGCKTAEQCWTSCCCYTPSQRLAWAKAHRVTPPDYAVLNDAPAERSAANSKRELEGASGKQSGTEWLRQKVLAQFDRHSQCGVSASCDDRDATQMSKCSEKQSGRSSCCSKPSASKRGNGNVARPKSKHSKYVLTMLALKCQGKHSVFTQLPWLVPNDYLASDFSFECSEQADLPVISKMHSIEYQPDTPPPKAFFA